MKRLVLLLAFATLAACAQKDAPPAQTQAQTTQTQNELAAAEPAGEPSRTAALDPDVPAGDYKMDPAHSSLIFRVDHLGFSKYTLRFRRFDAQLRFDPRDLTATQLTATVDPGSIETDFPDPKYNFNAELAGPQWLDAAKFPEIAFRTTRIEDLGNQAMRVHAELSMHGVTRPIVLDATYNGGYVGHPMDPHARVGFSARGVLRRSEFGISGGIPPAGGNMGVGDQVAIVIESEFNGPAMAKVDGAGAATAPTQ